MAALSAGVVWDNHACMPLRASGDFLPQLKRFRNNGVDVVSLNVGFADMSWADHIKTLSFMRQWIAQRPADYLLVDSIDDARRAKHEKKLGVVFDIEGMCPVQDDLSLVQTFYELGVRWMLIAYNRNNKAGGGCLDEDPGLLPVGRAIIDEMQRVGMVLCLSHTGKRTAMEALEYSRKPVIFSHSNPDAFNSHPRNISDDMMRRCAKTGGVVGINGIGKFLGATQDDVVDRVLEHLRHAIDIVGAEHVGLGLDYVFDQEELKEFYRKNPQLFPAGLNNSASGLAMVPPEAMGAIAEGLAKFGLSDIQVRGVLGENWVRVAQQVWN
jgi:membrane dipeptidase